MAEYKRPQSKAEYEENFEDIHPLMNPTMAYYESSRCLFCYDAPCIKACPTSIDIPLFIRQINNGNTFGAAKTIYDSNYFGLTCGKVCPTEVLCEGACVYNEQDVPPIDIGSLQAYATSEAIRQQKYLYTNAEENGKKVAIIGAGPAGISCACELRKIGYQADIFEAKSHPSGLVLHGNAPYKISNEEVLLEIQYLVDQFDFNIHYNNRIESREDFQQLEKNYDAIFMAVGLGNTRNIGLAGESLENCIGATEYIESIKLDPFNTHVGKKVIVIGGGNTAMDAASESARMGADEVILAYRRSSADMRAYDFEFDLAKSVGVRGLFHVQPVEVLGDKKVSGVRFVRTEYVDGKLKAISGTEFEISCDMVVKGTGQEKQKSFFEVIGLKLEDSGRLKVDNFQCSNKKYFAAGDAVNGGKEVVNACADAKLAAGYIHDFLSS
jgi:glutamate synthase (NADPH/NADH) small chain